MPNKKITVMIIDDHTLIRDTWRRLIGLYPEYEVVFDTGNGQQAIDTARDKRPNVALLDINMTPMNGFQILEMIRKFSPGTKVIAVSMHSQPAYAKKMMRLGAKGYVTKNSTSDELMHAIAEVAAGGSFICAEVKNILTEQTIGDSPQNNALNLLSQRELEIISLLRSGLSSKEIAETLFITSKTVEVHRHNILKKLQLKNSVALIEFINSHGL
jgi:two-component system, NarL family, invasion response regulator UvrY